jgi:hypothetical protein
MEYTIDTPSYNERRYGKPWIAVVVGKEYAWGEFEGRPGEAGRLIIQAEPGQLVAEGQKDIRKGRGGVDQYYLAMPDGTLWHENMNTEADAKSWARKGWKEYAEYQRTDERNKPERRAQASAMLGIPAAAEAPVIDVSGFYPEVQS